MLEKVAFVKTLLPDIRNYILSHRLFNFILGKLNFISNTALIIDAINGTIFMCPGLDCLVSDHPKYVELKDLRDVVELPPTRLIA